MSGFNDSGAADGGGVAFGGFDAEPEQVAESADVAASGPGFVQDAVLADTPDRHARHLVDVDVVDLTCATRRALAENAAGSRTQGSRIIVTGRLRRRG